MSLADKFSRLIRHNGRAILILLSIGLLFAIAWAGLMEFRAKDELTQARQALAKEDQDYEKAVRHYFRALNWYSPVGSSQTAANEFLALSLKLEEQGNRQAAFDALTKLRSALYAARSFYQPRRDILETVDPLLAWSLAEQAVGYDRPGRSLDFLAKAAFYQHIYSSPSLPREIWALAVEVGFWLWVSGVLIFIFWVFNSEAAALTLKARLARAWYAPAIFGAGYFLWVLGLLKA